MNGPMFLLTGVAMPSTDSGGRDVTVWRPSAPPNVPLDRIESIDHIAEAHAFRAEFMRQMAETTLYPLPKAPEPHYDDDLTLCVALAIVFLTVLFLWAMGPL